jgi:UrcA family protein
MSRLRLIAALGISCAFGAGGVAAAAESPASAPDSVVVRTDDVNLHSPAGARLIALRIRNAAAAACGGNVDPVAIRFSDGFRRCRETAIGRAVRELNAPLVATALDRAPQMLSRGD